MKNHENSKTLNFLNFFKFIFYLKIYLEMDLIY